MKACKPLLALLLALVLHSPTAQAQMSPCRPDGTQAELNVCAQDSLAVADAELNEVFQQILKRHAGDQDFLDRLKTAQARWIAFRDAEVDARFPKAGGDVNSLAYGSVTGMCMMGVREQLTRKRTAELRVWLDGVEEGDVCAGSYPMAEP